MGKIKKENSGKVHLKAFEEAVAKVLDRHCHIVDDAKGDSVVFDVDTSALPHEHVPLSSLQLNHHLLETMLSSSNDESVVGSNNDTNNNNNNSDNRKGDVFVMKEEDEKECWPFSELPWGARVRGGGGIYKPHRAKKKEAQLSSMLKCILSILSTKHDDERTNNKDDDDIIRIVDFCGGTGHLSLPLAYLLRDQKNIEIVVVDLKATSLELLHYKAENLHNENPYSNNTNIVIKKDSLKTRHQDVTQHEQILRRCKGLPNLYTFHGSIQNYHDPFDIGVALHACGQATDWVLHQCGRHEASFVVAPCCVGKLASTVRDPYLYRATATDNLRQIQYPQSSLLRPILSIDQFDALARAADISTVSQKTPSQATRRVAKTILEMDRLEYMREKYSYAHLTLTRMDPWEASPKHDILIGRKRTSLPSPAIKVSTTKINIPNQYCQECRQDTVWAYQQLQSLQNPTKSESKNMISSNDISGNDSVLASVSMSGDWSTEEVKDMKQFLSSLPPNTSYTFPTGMSSKERKLVHFAAQQLGLQHKSFGKKYNQKTVTVTTAKIQILF